MAPAHLYEVHAIESHSFSDPWPMEEILWEIENPDSICLAALENEKVAGYVTMRHLVDEGHISNIAVHEDYRKKGVGSALIEGLIAAAKSYNMVGITLEVRIGNRAAMALYHKYGFIVEGYRRGFYSYPTEDAAIMWKYI
ncbi:MAG: ribosomal protein S18-alanine N-acetyltransferase [Defluviitaleaceae bacterium]|nr:ribosomal protein S18-alanine N-acetyltransferase [Defluviitaleaceae bacterium]